MAVVFISDLAFSNDLANTRHSQDSDSQTTPLTTLNSNSCPVALKKLVESDYESKGAVLGLVSVKSNARECQNKLNGALGKINQISDVKNLSQKEKATSFLADHFPQIGKTAATTINNCNTSESSDDFIIKSRYYHATSKLEEMSKGLVDEIAYIDSMIPADKGLAKIAARCESSYIYPDLAKKCRKSASLSSAVCSQTPEQKLNDLTNNTINIMGEYSDLTEMLSRCEHNVHVKINNQKSSDCVGIRRIMETKVLKYPWINLPQFHSLKQFIKGRAQWSKETQDKMFSYTKDRLTQYLNQSRQAMVEQFDRNQNYTKCLSTNHDLNPADCNTEKISNILDKIPDPKINFEKNLRKLETPEHQAMSSIFETEQCLSKNRLDQQKKVDVINTTTEIGVAVAATVFTAGTYLVTSTGLKIVQGINRTNQLRRLSQVNTGLNALGAGINVSTTLAKCRSTELITKLDPSNASELEKHNVCPDPKITRLQDEEDSCATDVLLSALNVGSLGAGLGIMAKVNLKRKAELEEFIELVKKPGKQNRDLNFASAMTLDERIQVTEAVLERKLTPEQLKALKRAHELGPYDFDPDSPLTRQKDEILKTAGFTQRESAILRGNGIAGSWGTDESAYLGRTVNIPRSGGNRSVGEIIGIAERDAQGNPTKYKVGWFEASGEYGTKNVRVDEAIIQYKEGDKVNFLRSDKVTYSEGMVMNSGSDEKGLFYNIIFEENGVTKTRKNYYKEVTHIDPAQSAALAKASQEAAALRAAAAAKEAAERIAAEQRAAAERVAAVERQAVRDQQRPLIAELNSVASYNGRLNKLDDVRLAIGMPNASIEDLKLQVRRLSKKYYPDFLPPAIKLESDEAMKAVNRMMEIIKAAEKAPKSSNIGLREINTNC